MSRAKKNTPNHLTCGWPDCPRVAVRLFRQRTPEKSQPDEYYCDEHYPYDYCTRCKKKVRPFQAKAAYWPGTKAKGSSRPTLCMSCHQHNGEKALVFGPGEVDAVRALLAHRFAGDQAVQDELLTMMGIV